jgi:hypothetical protein
MVALIRGQAGFNRATRQVLSIDDWHALLAAW